MENVTAKNKAKELMQKAYDLDQHNKTTQIRCKQIALLCADEVFRTLVDAYPSKHQPHTFIEYWEDVKDEIKKM
jgi:hypothetical protein